MKPIGGNDEKELSREELEMVLTEAVGGIAVVSPRSDGISLDYTNEGFFSIFGYTREEYELLGDDVRLNLFNPGDFMNLISKINTVTEPGFEQKFECRINKKGGEKGWVIINTRKPRNAKPGDQVFVINIIDITDQKKLQMQIQEEKERYEIVEEISDNILFTYDVLEDVLDCSPKILRGLRRGTRLENAIEAITYGDYLDHRDVPVFIEALSNALSGKRLNIFDARILNMHDDGIWYRVKFATVFNEEGSPIKFIGTMIDIDKEKKEKSRLIVQAETDQLTGFMNKISTGLKISEAIKEKPDDCCAMYLLDIDDFKKLNDTYGHQEGDSFLRQFTSKMSCAFRTSDILGRVGGEEFVIYIKSVNKSPNIVEEKAKEIEKICHSIRIASAPEKEFSCSIGIALYPEAGLTYSQLYERADRAMYYVKKNGKNDYAFFDEFKM